MYLSVPTSQPLRRSLIDLAPPWSTLGLSWSLMVRTTSLRCPRVTDSMVTLPRPTVLPSPKMLLSWISGTRWSLLSTLNSELSITPSSFSLLTHPGESLSVWDLVLKTMLTPMKKCSTCAVKALLTDVKCVDSVSRLSDWRMNSVNSKITTLWCSPLSLTSMCLRKIWLLT
jgi:hypothetical protein